ncbi:MAG: hypothetical protein E6R04_06575 [Spirochaetes bacterium]|nr:MAG: hypothetical protein E6R04_06575 [Spirochaetota bacterium]
MTDPTYVAGVFDSEGCVQASSLAYIFIGVVGVFAVLIGAVVAYACWIAVKHYTMRIVGSQGKDHSQEPDSREDHI